MNERNNEPRVNLVMRINVRPASHAAIRSISVKERISVPTIIGMAIEEYVTARSTT